MVRECGEGCEGVQCGSVVRVREFSDGEGCSEGEGSEGEGV